MKVVVYRQEMIYSCESWPVVIKTLGQTFFLEKMKVSSSLPISIAFSMVSLVVFVLSLVSFNAFVSFPEAFLRFYLVALWVFRSVPSPFKFSS